MEFARKSVKPVNVTKGSYQHYHYFYNKTPQGHITLQQFETYALERLKVLKAVEMNNILPGKTLNEKDAELSNQLNSLGWSFVEKLILSNDEEEKDFLSHHILRLAYAKSESKRQWFVTQEIELMKFRIRRCRDLISKMMSCNDFDCKPVGPEEMNELQEELNSCRVGNTPQCYYKVDFEEVLQLVAIRKVFLRHGYAYIADSDLSSFVVSKYRTYLKEQLAIICKHLPGLEEENRIMKQLQALSGGDLGNAYNINRSSGDKITADMLDSLSQHSYPLCMQILHDHVKTKHHLKHEGRMQYGLFLKGIGVSLEESLKFWRTQFTKGSIDADKFDKTYAYNIRHNYGKEGKRTDYTPYSCMKIIGRIEPKGDECHGCPYKHGDYQPLKQLLAKKKISAEATEEIMALKKQGHYQIACMTLFRATHPQSEGLQNGLQHPNQYFEESQSILNGETGVKKEKTASSVPPAPPKAKIQDDKENIEFDDDFEMQT